MISSANFSLDKRVPVWLPFIISVNAIYAAYALFLSSCLPLFLTVDDGIVCCDARVPDFVPTPVDYSELQVSPQLQRLSRTNRSNIEACSIMWLAVLEAEIYTCRPTRQFIIPHTPSVHTHSIFLFHPISKLHKAQPTPSSYSSFDTIRYTVRGFRQLKSWVWSAQSSTREQKNKKNIQKKLKYRKETLKFCK